MAYQKDESPKGKIFFRANEYKTPENNQPDYKGQVQIPIEMLESINEEHITEFRGVRYVTFQYGIWQGETDYMMGSVQLPLPKKEESKEERGKPWKKKGQPDKVANLPF